MRVTKSIVPNFFTLMNLFMGFAAIVYISTSNHVMGALCVLMAAVFDSLDGVMARLIKATSDLGAELDSLCDGVSFGVAPAFMLYKMYFYQYGELGILFASFPALAGITRLARFNVQLTSFEDKLYFTGLPIPAGALTIISYLIYYHITNLMPIEYKDIAIFTVTIGVSLAMVSRIKYDNMPRPSKKGIKRKPVVFALFVIGIIGSVISKGYLIFPFMALVVIGSAIRQIFFYIMEKREVSDDMDESDDVD